MIAIDAKLPAARACVSTSNLASPFVAMILLLFAGGEHPVAATHEGNDRGRFLASPSAQEPTLDQVAQWCERRVEDTEQDHQDRKLGGPHAPIVAVDRRVVKSMPAG